MIENKVLFYKSYIPDLSIESVSRNDNFKSFKSISINTDKLAYYNKLSWLSPKQRAFNEIRNPFKQRQIATLSFIFLPPGFSYLFSYYDTCTCKLTEDLSKLISRYSYAKQAARERYIMDPNEEEIEFGYISSKRG